MDIIPACIAGFLHVRALRRSNSSQRQRRRPRIFRIRLFLPNMLDVEVYKSFRLNKQAIMELYLKIEEKLKNTTERSHALTGVTKLLAVLYFLGSGVFQHCAAARLGISQPSFSVHLRKVLNAIMSVAKDYIIFPSSTENIQSFKEQFFAIAGMPNVIGCIDCTHVAFVPPADFEHIYRNRKMFRSINVQMVVGPHMQIIDVVANFPGSCHDSFILQGSELYRRFQAGNYGDSIILGDNGYRLNRWLMTPYLNPQTAAQSGYNHAHRKTRSLVERTFGILKSRFRALDVSGGALLYKPKLVCKIIIACAVLHNIANQHNIPTQIADDLREEVGSAVDNNVQLDGAGQLVRQHITDNFFGH